jgi:hypothetical protein
MSSEDMVRLGLVNRNLSIAERQGSSGIVLRPERPGERKRKHTTDVDPASVEYRKRVLAQNEAERRKAKADIQRALEGQEAKKWEEKKRREK